MEVQEIFDNIASRMVKGMMFHEQMTEYYLFLNLKGYSRCHEYHFMTETCCFLKLCKFYTKTYNKLVNPEIRGESFIPESWYNHTRQDVDSATIQDAVKKGLEMWRDWEKETREFYCTHYKELMEAGEIHAALYLEKLIKEVSHELEKVESYHLSKTAIGYDISSIIAEQKHKHDKYQHKTEKVGKKLC